MIDRMTSQEDRMKDIALDIFLDDAKCDEMEELLYRLISSAFTTGFEAGKLTYESLEHMRNVLQGPMKGDGKSASKNEPV